MAAPQRIRLERRRRSAEVGFAAVGVGAEGAGVGLGDGLADGLSDGLGIGLGGGGLSNILGGGGLCDGLGDGLSEGLGDGLGAAIAIIDPPEPGGGTAAGPADGVGDGNGDGDGRGCAGVGGYGTAMQQPGINQERPKGIAREFTLLRRVGSNMIW